MEKNLLDSKNNDTYNSELYEKLLIKSHMNTEGKECKIMDLCTEDKKRIVHLIEELTRSNEQKRELEGKLSILICLQKKQDKQIAKLSLSKLEVQQEMQKKIRSLEAGIKACLSGRQNIEKTLKKRITESETELQKLKYSLEKIADDNKNLEFSISYYKNKLVKYSCLIQKQECELKLAKNACMKVDIEAQTDIPNSSVTHVASQTDEDTFHTEKQNYVKSMKHTEHSGNFSMDDRLLNELFFSTPNIPSEFESIFFLPTIRVQDEHEFEVVTNSTI